MQSYGVRIRSHAESHIDDVVEQVRNLGYAVLDSGYSQTELTALSRAFDEVHAAYLAKHGESKLISANEHNTIRALLTQGKNIFLELALSKRLLQTIEKLISGSFILNQQNGVINPPQSEYNQGAWHRDLPYQHFVSSSPLAINALFCLDEFTLDNGATYVLPASHKSEEFPSEVYIKRNAIQVTAKPGNFIILDCMLFHSGGYNKTLQSRRAINHVFNIPYFKQQINLPNNLSMSELSVETIKILGFNTMEAQSVDAYLSERFQKTK
ncbi:MAG: phytanoyl-CoA dioxygenase family protein [Bordetella sp.]|uniref:phytanoyl-CoA dioxygenase family protein n=1 Tax=Bordetella sp. TaxID=28081 RepID=UPI003F7CC9D6